MQIQEIESAITKLSAEKVNELSTWLEAYQADLWKRKNESENSRANEDKWDKLFSKPDSKQVMRAMAQEAREEFHAGRTTGIAVTEDGRLSPS